MQLRELGQLGEHGVHAQQHVILVLELEQGAILVVSHVLAAHLILEIVTVSYQKYVFYHAISVHRAAARHLQGFGDSQMYTHFS